MKYFNMKTLLFLRNKILVNLKCAGTFSPRTRHQSQTWCHPVEPFATLKGNLKNCQITVSSFDEATKLPHEKLAIEIDSPTDIQHYDVKSNDKYIKILNTSKNSAHLDKMHVLLPPMTNIDLKLEEQSCLDVTSGLELDTIKVTSESGSINMKQIKAATIEITTEHGDVNISKALHGKVEITANNNGNIKTNRIQGPNVELYSENGCVTSTDLYSDDLIVKSDTGNVNIKSTHGHCDVDSDSGDVFIGTVDGDLNVTATEGDVDVYITKPRWVYLHTNKGKINLFTNPAVAAQLHVEAETYNIDPTLNPQRKMSIDYDYCKKCRFEIGNGEDDPDFGMVYLHAPLGLLDIRNMSWFDRIKSR